MELCARNPGLVKGLCVLDMSPFEFDPAIIQYFKATIGFLRKLDLKQPREIINAELRTFLMDKLAVDYFMNALTGNENDFAWAFELDGLEDLMDSYKESITKQPFKGPVRFIISNLSELIPLERLSSLREFCPLINMKTDVIGLDYGHFFFIEAPDKSASLIAEFIQRNNK